MTPKSLLRLPAATSTLEELADGGFQRVIDDPAVPEDRIEGDQARAVLGQGLLRHRRARGPRERGPHRRRAGRDALPVPRERAARPDGQLPQPRAGGVGPGGAAQHGRRAPSCAGGWRRSCPSTCTTTTSGRQLRAAQSEGYAAAHRKEQAGSCAWRWTSRTTCSSPTPRPSGRSCPLLYAGRSALRGLAAGHLAESSAAAQAPLQRAMAPGRHAGRHSLRAAARAAPRPPPEPPLDALDHRVGHLLGRPGADPWRAAWCRSRGTSPRRG